MKSTVVSKMKCALLASVLGLAVITPSMADTGSSGNPNILPPKSSAQGKTYGEWVAAWWQWALSIPADRNPLTDTTGQFGAEAQGGPMWFLAGTFGNSADRSYVVPQGKMIFLPVFNWIFGAGAFDCQPSVPGVTCDVPSLIATAAANTEAATALDVSIDGVAVQNVRNYRAASPGPFSINYPDNSVTGLPSGNYFPNVADGYWLILTPFAPGAHTIQVHVNAPATSNGPIEFTIVWRLTVQ